ncbi:MAG: yjgR, partial [Hyphomicrobiales bacterium]|nr:yjgR [Hyphomicrobiales bacterium]
FEYLNLPLANRHGLITGATGTGKTVTLQTLAEGFSNAGVPVFAADVKGDLSGIAMPGEEKPHFTQRAKDLGFDWQADEFPVVFWDLFGEQGHPIRATISEMGPLLLSRLLECNDVQEGVINIVFRVADENGLLLLDLKDFRALLQYVSDNAGELKTKYGNVAPATIGMIQRQLLVLENQGAAKFFAEPALDLNDFLRKDRDGRGVVNMLAADKLMRSPRLYGTFLLWMLSELFEQLPEVGDLPKPKLVFFFDEAHLLFDDAPKPLLDAIEQVVRLIRSKGVGVYFITQNPLDVPETVLGQLGNRVQHALRAFTPRDQRAVRAAAETFRQRAGFDTAKAIMELKVGEALVSTLQDKGAPSEVAQTLVAPPSGRVGPITPQERASVQKKSPFGGKYDAEIDRESAFEVLQKRAEAATAEANAPESGGLLGQLGGMLGGMLGGEGPAKINPKTGKPMPGRRGQSMGEKIIASAAQSAARSLGTQITRAILRNVLGGIMGGKK